jgi:hypothetical protein
MPSRCSTQLSCPLRPPLLRSSLSSTIYTARCPHIRFPTTYIGVSALVVVSLPTLDAATLGQGTNHRRTYLTRFMRPTSAIVRTLMILQPHPPLAATQAAQPALKISCLMPADATKTTAFPWTSFTRTRPPYALSLQPKTPPLTGAPSSCAAPNKSSRSMGIPRLTHVTIVTRGYCCDPCMYVQGTLPSFSYLTPPFEASDHPW